MAKVLITGGAGFIGSHTSHRFLSAGHEVTVLDAFHVYTLPIQPSFLENMNFRFTHLLKQIRVIRGSTLNKDDMRRTILEVRPEYIVHFAGLPLANEAVRQSEEAFQGILQGTVNVLEVIRDVDFVKRFVYLSSSLAYGDFREVPVPEDAEMDPKDIYGGMKLAGEILTRTYSRRYGFPYTILRPSAVYGPTDNNRRVIQAFVENAVSRKPIEVNRGPDAVLDFTYVKDVAEGIFLATVSEEGVGQEFNVTRGEGRSLSEVVKILQVHFPDIQVEERQEEGSRRPRRGALDISKARKLLGYQPKWTLEQGLGAYLSFMREFNFSLF